MFADILTNVSAVFPLLVFVSWLFADKISSQALFRIFDDRLFSGETLLNPSKISFFTSPFTLPPCKEDFLYYFFDQFSDGRRRTEMISSKCNKRKYLAAAIFLTVTCNNN